MNLDKFVIKEGLRQSSYKPTFVYDFLGHYHKNLNGIKNISMWYRKRTQSSENCKMRERRGMWNQHISRMDNTRQQEIIN